MQYSSNGFSCRYVTMQYISILPPNTISVILWLRDNDLASVFHSRDIRMLFFSMSIPRPF